MAYRMKTNQVILMIFIFLCYSCSSVLTDKLTIIAHRGASGHLPEHSLAALALAHSFDPDFLEADIVMTKDNELIVLHDLYLDATTNVADIYPKRKREDGRYYAIDFNLKEIQLLQLKERFSPRTQQLTFPTRYPEGESGLRVPSFDQFIKMVHSLNRTFSKKIGIYPEIKKPEFHLSEGKDITKAVIKKVTDWGYEQRATEIFIQSFWPQALQRIRNEFQSEIPLIQLIAENSWNESSTNYDEMLTQKGLKRISHYANGIGPWLKQVHPELTAKAHENGLLVHAYTHRSDQIPKGLSKKKYIKKILSLGIDGVFTDFPDEF
jgi:glycerophosphoryl diester phosphodiesterase